MRSNEDAESMGGDSKESGKEMFLVPGVGGNVLLDDSDARFLSLVIFAERSEEQGTFFSPVLSSGDHDALALPFKGASGGHKLRAVPFHFL